MLSGSSAALLRAVSCVVLLSAICQAIHVPRLKGHGYDSHLRNLLEDNPHAHKQHCRIVSPFAGVTTDEWMEGSMRNLSSWRSDLMLRQHQLWNANRGSVSDQEATKSFRRDLPMYQLYFGSGSCPPPMALKYYGPGIALDPNVFTEGGKWLCGPLPQNDCIIYSLGSNNDYSFEQAVLKDTTCKIWTFDCTVVGMSIDPARHTYEKVCVGDAPPDGSQGDRVYERLDVIMKRLGHTQITYLKIDCEGCEFDIMEHWHEEDTHLPLQIAVEIHEWGHLYSNVDMYMRHMAGLGYVVLTKSDNTWRGGPDDPGCCAEMLLLKVEQRFCSRHIEETQRIAITR